jgi:hypothetical protein
MRALRTAGLVIFSLILFISLTAFGLAFWLDRTVLNRDFITAEGEKLEMAAIAGEAMSQASAEGYSTEALDSLTETITTLEPQLKAELNTIIYSVYEYLHGDREDLELTNLLGLTLLSPDFIIAIIDTMDGPEMASLLWEEFGEEIMQEFSFPEEASSHLIADLGELLTDLKPWAIEQVEYISGPISDYLDGETESFSVTISLEPLRDGFRGVLLGVFLDFPPDELEGLPPEDLEQAFDIIWVDFADAMLPATFEIDETVIGAGGPLQIAAVSSEAEAALNQVRGYFSRIRLAFILSIVVNVLLIAGIVLIYRNVRGSTRTLGIVFLASGLVLLVLALLGKNVGGEYMLQAMVGTPQQLQVWASQVLVDLMAPLQWLAVGFMVGGAGMLAASFAYKPSETLY